MKRIDHPYVNLASGQWLRGNLHAHTTASDGHGSIQAVIADYAGRGYDFLMISDHDLLTSEGDYRNVEDHGLILIPGNEVSANGPHLLHVHADRRVEPDANRQRVLDVIADARGFAVMNHPNWQGTFDYCSMQQFNMWTGYTGIEIYNGVIGRLEGSPYATNKWDMLLSAGRRVWGFANDDSHLPVDDVELGWNVAYAADRSVDGVIEALQTGRFYASTGVTIADIQVDGTCIRVETTDAERIVALTCLGRRVSQANGKTIEIDAANTEGYVRFECWGRGERFAWTQPFFLAEE